MVWMIISYWVSLFKYKKCIGLKEIWKKSATVIWDFHVPLWIIVISIATRSLKQEMVPSPFFFYKGRGCVVVHINDPEIFSPQIWIIQFKLRTTFQRSNHFWLRKTNCISKSINEIHFENWKEGRILGDYDRRNMRYLW